MFLWVGFSYQHCHLHFGCFEPANEDAEAMTANASICLAERAAPSLVAGHGWTAAGWVS